MKSCFRHWYNSSKSGVHHIQCTVNENYCMNILFHFGHELRTCVDFKPPSIVPIIETSITRGAGSVVVLTRADAAGLLLYLL